MNLFHKVSTTPISSFSPIFFLSFDSAPSSRSSYKSKIIFQWSMEYQERKDVKEPLYGTVLVKPSNLDLKN